MNNNLQQHQTPITFKLGKFFQWLPESLGKVISILSFVLVLDIFVVVVLRYLFDQPSVMLQEAGMWFHSIIFMLGAAYTFSADEHVRVDIFYRGNSQKYKAWVNIIGSLLLLLPLCVYLFINSWHYVLSSWHISEASQEVGGLPALYLLKTLILLLPVLLSLQAFATIFKNIALLQGYTESLTEEPALTADKDSAATHQNKAEL